MRDRIDIFVKILKQGKVVELDVPINITANELVIALNTAFDLKINVLDAKKCYIKAENPLVLLKGNKTLEKFGIRDGSIINITE